MEPQEEPVNEPAPESRANAFGEPWIPPTYRRVCIDPIQDLIEACEAMPGFSADPGRHADLVCAKLAITEATPDA